MAATGLLQADMDRAVRHLVVNHSPKGEYVGWLMLASILVEAWDLYAIGFVLIFIRDQFQPSALMLGLAAAATQAGALIGAVAGGWLTDKVGRRVMFLTTMVMFIVLALAQSVVTSIVQLVVVRLFLGFPLGGDITTGYTYIMEFLPKGRREIVGNRAQFFFAVGNIMAVAVVALFLVFGMNHEWVWRIALGLGAVPAAIILWLRSDLPETAIWLIRQGRFRDAKQIAQQMYNDPLEMLPDENFKIPAPRPSAFLADIRKDPIRWRSTLYGWLASFCQASQFQTFGFYMPVLFSMVGVSTVLGNDLTLMMIYCCGAVSAWVSQDATAKVGQRGISMIGFSIVLASLLAAAWALYTGRTFVLPLAAFTLAIGQYPAALNCITIPSMVARPEYRGTATGFSYAFVKMASFLAIFLFPSIFTAIGQANSTLLVAIFPLCGLALSIWLLPEIYGFEQD